MEIVKVKGADFGIEEKKAKQISDMFKPMLDKMVELEEEYNEVIKLEMGEEASKRAREVRLKYVKVRGGVNTVHKDLKDFYLKGGRFVDGWKNAALMAAQGNEEKLKAIEQHQENLEKERILSLQNERAAELEKLDCEVIPPNLGELDAPMWNSYLEGQKASHQRKLEEAEKDRVKAEQEAREREEEEKKRELHNERLLLASPYKEYIPEFEEIEWGELSIKDLKEHLSEAKAKAKAKEEENKKAREEAARLAAELKAKEEAEEKRKKAEEARLKKEREAKEKAEAALKAMEDEEKMREEKKEQDRQAALNADDATKVLSLIGDLETLTDRYTFKSDKNQKTYENVGILIGKVITYIQSQ